MEKIVWNFAGRTTFTRVLIGEAKTVTDSPPLYIHTLSDSHQFNDIFETSMRPVNLVAVNLISLLEVAKLALHNGPGIIDCPIFLPTYRKFSLRSKGGTCRPHLLRQREDDSIQRLNVVPSAKRAPCSQDHATTPSMLKWWREYRLC